MSASNAFETAILQAIFNATTIANLLQDIAGSPSGLTHLFVGLHTADPGEAGSQNTSEAAYTNYLRVGVLRTAAGWTISGNSVTNAAEVLFPEASAGTDLLTHFSIGASPTGAGTLYFSGALASSLQMAASVQPRFTAGQLTVTAD
jgi:hypothetical protein